MSADEIVDRSFESDALMICHSEILSSDVVARLSDRLQIVANYSVGVDHCDLSALRERGIVVTNTPDVLSDATAEIAMLLLLGASRRAYEGDQMLRQGTWKHWAPIEMNGIQVTSKSWVLSGWAVLVRQSRSEHADLIWRYTTPIEIDFRQSWNGTRSFMPRFNRCLRLWT